MKAPNIQPMTTAWMRRSGEMAENPRLMAARAPLAFRVFRSKIAPKMISSTSRAFMAPNRE